MPIKYDELMALKGLYRQLYDVQMGLDTVRRVSPKVIARAVHVRGDSEAGSLISHVQRALARELHGTVDPDALAIRLTVKKDGTDLHVDFSESSPPCRGPLNSVIATTKAAVYLAIKHIFPDVPINAGCFEPLRIADPHGTSLHARYPRPVSGRRGPPK